MGTSDENHSPKGRADRETELRKDSGDGRTSHSENACGAFNSAVAEEGEPGVGAELNPLVEHKDIDNDILEEDTRPSDKQQGHDYGGNYGSESDKKDKADVDSALLQDRGWAWLVVLGGFLSHVITGGFERSDGVLFLKFTEQFGESAQLTAWPGALCSTIRLLMGPAASAMSNRFSARTSCMIGTFIFTAGVIISGFAPNLLYLIFSYGILQGIGRGLVYAPGLIIVGMYVNRHRGLGVGLSTAGVGVGTFIFPPVVELLFESFGFRGAFLIMGGLALNLCVAAALYRPLSVHRSIVIGQRKSTSAKDEEAVALTATSNSNTKNKDGEPTVEIINDAVQVQPTNTLDSNADCVQVRNVYDAPKTTAYSPRKSRTGVFFRSAFTTCFPVEETKKESSKRKLIEWSLLKIPPFLFYCFSICLFTAAFKSAFTFLPALAKSKGLSEIEAAYLLSISGVLDTIGRILSGVILDIERICPFRPIVYNGVIFIIVALSFVSPFLASFAEFAVLFGLYGALTGTYVSQKSVILVDILGQEKLSSSFGLMICFQGLGTFIGPPMSGLLKDVFGRYNEAFYLGGAAMAGAGGLMIVSNVYRVAREQTRDQTAAKICS